MQIHMIVPNKLINPAPPGSILFGATVMVGNSPSSTLDVIGTIAVK
jgi:hypothetical protein